MCVKICECNSCAKRNTCADCEYMGEIKTCDCQTSGVQNCPHYRVKYNPFDDNKRTKPEKYDVYTSVLLNREELILLRKLCEQIDDTKMRLNLTNRFGGALLKFGSPLFETKVRVLDEEHES